MYCLHKFGSFPSDEWVGVVAFLDSKRLPYPYARLYVHTTEERQFSVKSPQCHALVTSFTRRQRMLIFQEFKIMDIHVELTNIAIGY